MPETGLVVHLPGPAQPAAPARWKSGQLEAGKVCVFCVCVCVHTCAGGQRSDPSATTAFSCLCVRGGCQDSHDLNESVWSFSQCSALCSPQCHFCVRKGHAANTKAPEIFLAGLPAAVGNSAPHGRGRGREESKADGR